MRPAFTVAAGNGSVTTWTGNWGTSWGVKGFGGVIGVTDELQYDVGTGLTEELIFGLGGKTSRVDTRLDLFMREEPTASPSAPRWRCSRPPPLPATSFPASRPPP